MANIYSSEYTQEFLTEPSQQAPKGTQNAPIKCFLGSATTVASADVVYLCKLQHKAVFLGLESVVGALGAGAVQAIDNKGTVTAIAKGDEVNGQVEGGVSICLVADGTTAATLKVLVKFLMD